MLRANYGPERAAEKRRGSAAKPNPLFYLVPEVGLEPTRFFWAANFESLEPVADSCWLQWLNGLALGWRGVQGAVPGGRVPRVSHSELKPAWLQLLVNRRYMDRGLVTVDILHLRGNEPHLIGHCIVRRRSPVENEEFFAEVGSTNLRERRSHKIARPNHLVEI